MSRQERPTSASNTERQPLSTDASRIHTALTTLLRERGDRAGNLPDAQYCIIAIPGQYHEVATVSNYFTRLVHKAHQTPDKAAETDIHQLKSINNNDAVIDIDFTASSYICFRPIDIRPERSYVFGMPTAVLKSLPQDQFVLYGPQGLVDVANNDQAQFLAACLNCETAAEQ